MHSERASQSPPGRLHSVHDRASAARGRRIFLAPGSARGTTRGPVHRSVDPRNAPGSGALW